MTYPQSNSPMKQADDQSDGSKVGNTEDERDGISLGVTGDLQSETRIDVQQASFVTHLRGLG